MKKKFLTLVAIGLMVSALAACGEQKEVSDTSVGGTDQTNAVVTQMPEVDDKKNDETVTPELTPEVEPTAEPTAEPTKAVEPTATTAPTATPEPTAEPTKAVEPTEAPVVTEEPTATPEPTAEPTQVPTPEPTEAPVVTEEPTATPEPTAEPTQAPVVTEAPTPEVKKEAVVECDVDSELNGKTISEARAYIEAHGWEISERYASSAYVGYTFVGEIAGGGVAAVRITLEQDADYNGFYEWDEQLNAHLEAELEAMYEEERQREEAEKKAAEEEAARQNSGVRTDTGVTGIYWIAAEGEKIEFKYNYSIGSTAKTATAHVYLDTEYNVSKSDLEYKDNGVDFSDGYDDYDAHVEKGDYTFHYVSGRIEYILVDFGGDTLVNFGIGGTRSTKEYINDAIDFILANIVVE